MINLALAMLLFADYQLEWRDLPQQVLGRNVSLTTPDGVKLKGRVLGFEEDGMRMKIARTSDRRIFPRGDGMVPRGSITEMRVDKTAGRTWRVVGVAILGAVGVAIGVPVLVIAYEPVAAAVAIGGGVALGYVCGWGADQKVVRIQVAP